MAKKIKIPGKLQVWAEARERYHLSDTHIQMAQELGLNPKNFPKYAANRHQPWKQPLAQFIERIYFKQFKRSQPLKIVSIERRAQAHWGKAKKRKKAKATRRSAAAS